MRRLVAAPIVRCRPLPFFWHSHVPATVCRRSLCAHSASVLPRRVAARGRRWSALFSRRGGSSSFSGSSRPTRRRSRQRVAWASLTRSLQKRVLFQHMLLLLLLLLLQRMLVLLQLMLVLLQLVLVLADPGSHGATLGSKLGVHSSLQAAASALASRHRRARACPRRHRRRARLLLHQHHALSTRGGGAATGGRRNGH